MTLAELEKRLQEFRAGILREFDGAKGETPAEAALKRLECLPGFSQHSNQDDSKWMFREGVRQAVKRMEEILPKNADDWLIPALAAIEKELLA